MNRLMLVLLVLIGMTPTLVNAQETNTFKVKLLNVYDEIPTVIKDAPDDVYKTYAEVHNNLAYKHARDLANGYLDSPSEVIIDVTKITERGTIPTLLDFNSRSNRSYQSSRTEETLTRSYSKPRWGGGPVLILNPYVRQ